MAEKASKIVRWLKTLGRNAIIAIDDGGLTLVDIDSLAYYEIGGIPKERSVAKSACTCSKSLKKLGMHSSGCPCCGAIVRINSTPPLKERKKVRRAGTGLPLQTEKDRRTKTRRRVERCEEWEKEVRGRRPTR